MMTAAANKTLQNLKIHNRSTYRGRICWVTWFLAKSPKSMRCTPISNRSLSPFKSWDVTVWVRLRLHFTLSHSLAVVYSVDELQTYPLTNVYDPHYSRSASFRPHLTEACKISFILTSGRFVVCDVSQYSRVTLAALSTVVSNNDVGHEIMPHEAETKCDLKIRGVVFFYFLMYYYEGIFRTIDRQF